MPGFRLGKKRAVEAPATGRPNFVLDESTEPLYLDGGRVKFMVGLTSRRAIETHLGPAVQYPAPGWRTWACAGPRGDTWILSAIYRGQVLIGIEHYMAKTENLPRDTPPANGIFRMMPGDIMLGNRIKGLGDRFLSAAGSTGGARAVVFQHAYEARWKYGIALVCGNDGRIERIAIYATQEMPTIG
jgi:hypothetical protein